jgi:uncharacterized protein (TIGR03435 family)
MATTLRPHSCSACAIPVTRRLRPSRFIVAAAIFFIAGVLHAPRPRAQAPAADAGFEVASVKPNKAGGPFPFGRIGLLPGGRFTGLGATLPELIRAAYGLREDAQISGGQNWITADRFDVEAKAPADASPAQVQAMLKALLADRFTLTAHTESRQLPLYALVMAKSDGTMGARLRRSGTECAPITIPAELGPAPPPPPPPPAGAPRLLVARTPMRCGSMLVAGMVSARSITMDQFIVRLSAFVGRPVIDRTGLTGEFDLDLSYTPESPTRAAIGVPADGPSIFTALPEQLGLKLDPQRGPVDVFVIDRAERPTPD